MIARPSVPTPLHAILGSIVAATLAGCAGSAESDFTSAESDSVSINPVGAATSASPIIAGKNDELVCVGYGASRANGLAPDFAYDSFAYYLESVKDPGGALEFALVEQAGTPCASAPDPGSCSAEIDSVRSAALDDVNHYSFPVHGALLIVTGVLGVDRERLEQHSIRSSDADGAPTTRSSVSTIDDLEELLAFLGRIDTPNEAALVMSVGWGSALPCGIQRDGQDYVATQSRWVEGLCPPTEQRYELRVTPDGVYSETPRGEPYTGTGCVGRRPDGLCVAATRETGASAETAGEWLARTARLEVAAVAAFLQLARELGALGAPPGLLARLRDAARDEVAHAEQMTALARARGAESSPAVVVLRPQRSVIEIALENAVEGCVRECWGALCARFQARAAVAPDVRAAFVRIARDEADHAQLSRDVAAWLEVQLDPTERARVAAARREAVDALSAELDRELPSAWCQELGLPTRQQALTALDALERAGLMQAA